MIRGLPAPRTWGEVLAIAVALAAFGYFAWDAPLWDARAQLVLHLMAICTIGGIGLLVVRGGSLPETPIDLPLLGLLAAFALATASALNVGMSLRAMAAIVAFAAMLPAAIIAVRWRPAWVGLLTSVPVLVLSVPTMALLLGRRVEWILAGGPGLPPLRLLGEGTSFGSVAVPPFVIVPAWALAGLIEPLPLRRGVRAGLVTVGVPLTILSGSRSAWLAIAAAGAIALLPHAWRARHRLRPRSGISRRTLLIGAAALVAGLFALVLVLPRLTAVTSVLYRAALWRDTLAAWASDPVLGVGPGFMQYARQAAAPDFTFPVRQPHSHNLPLGLLGDAGLIGLAAGIALVATLLVVAGPWRSRTSLGRTASAVLFGLGVGGLFEDLTFLPGFCLLAIALVAVALLDADAVTWRRPRHTSVRGARRVAAMAAGGAAGAVLLAAMFTNDAGGIAYRAGIDAAVGQRWEASTAYLERAVVIDPWHPAGPAALAVAAESAGRLSDARRAAEHAGLLNPGDARSWVNLAILCERLEDAACQAEAGERAAAKARYSEIELINAAVQLDRVGATAPADAAFRSSLLSEVTTSFTIDWPRAVRIGDGSIADYTDASSQVNRLVAKHAMGEPIEPAEYADPAVRALAHAIRGERPEAEALLASAIDGAPDQSHVWDIAIVLRDAWGQPIDDELRVAAVIRGRDFPSPEAAPRLPRQVFDIGSFRAYPRNGFVRGAIRHVERPVYPWLLSQLIP